MIKISSIIIAKNEEQNILRCINSLINCVDEIIVIVDDSSNDTTLEIVKAQSEISEKVKYFLRKWEGFSASKKFAVEQTNFDWIFWIDADEALTPELQNEILNFKRSEPQFDLYSIPRKANFLGRWILHSGWYPGRVKRIFNKHKVKFDDKPVHENLIYTGNTGEFKNDLEHYTDPNIKHYFEKFNHYTTLAANELAAKNKKANLSDLILRPLFLFIKMYILKRGFLDGIQGFILAVFSSLYVFTKYAKLWEKRFKDEMIQR